MQGRDDAAAPGDWGVVLAARRRALVREMHVLRGHPELLWQQLHNRLRWEDKLVAALPEPELRRRTAPAATPWLWTRTRYGESQALRRTLKGHSSCAFSPDDARVVSDALTLWDAETGKEILTIAGHVGGVWACAYGPCGTRVASASREVKLWDTGTGGELRTIEGHSDFVNDCAYSPDGARVISGTGQYESIDGQLVVWNVQTGQSVSTLEDIRGFKACAFSPDEG